MPGRARALGLHGGPGVQGGGVPLNSGRHLAGVVTVSMLVHDAVWLRGVLAGQGFLPGLGVAVVLLPSGLVHPFVGAGVGWLHVLHLPVRSPRVVPPAPSLLPVSPLLWAGVW